MIRQFHTVWCWLSVKCTYQSWSTASYERRHQMPELNLPQQCFNFNVSWNTATDPAEGAYRYDWWWLIDYRAPGLPSWWGGEWLTGVKFLGRIPPPRTQHPPRSFVSQSPVLRASILLTHSLWPNLRALFYPNPNPRSGPNVNPNTIINPNPKPEHAWRFIVKSM